MALRPWLVIPIGGIVATTIALMLSRAPGTAIAVGFAAAAITATVCALAGHSPASIVGSVVAAGLVGFGVVETRPALAIAAAGFAIVELVRASPRSPVPAIAAAFVAAFLDPSFVALAPVAGLGLRGPRWTLIIPALGALVVGLAAIAAFAWPSLWQLWSGHPIAARSIDEALVGIADSLGPTAAVATIMGLALLPRRGWVVVALAVGTVVAASRSGAPAGYGIAALAIGLAITRLAAMIRFPAGQACVAATTGFIVVASIAISR